MIGECTHIGHTVWGGVSCLTSSVVPFVDSSIVSDGKATMTLRLARKRQLEWII